MSKETRMFWYGAAIGVGVYWFMITTIAAVTTFKCIGG